jgi:hypothetical protein
MSAILDRLLSRNPLLAHGPRTHATGVPLPSAAPAPTRRRTARWDVDAPRVHLGREHRAS